MQARGWLPLPLLSISQIQSYSLHGKACSGHDCICWKGLCFALYWRVLLQSIAIAPTLFFATPSTMFMVIACILLNIEYLDVCSAGFSTMHGNVVYSAMFSHTLSGFGVSGWSYISLHDRLHRNNNPLSIKILSFLSYLSSHKDTWYKTSFQTKGWTFYFFHFITGKRKKFF